MLCAARFAQRRKNTQHLFKKPIKTLAAQNPSKLSTRYLHPELEGDYLLEEKLIKEREERKKEKQSSF